MLFIVAGASGTGKSYLIAQMVGKYHELFSSPPLVTTRHARQRAYEDRQSVTLEEFQRMQVDGEFAIAGEFHGNRYGYPAEILHAPTPHVIVNSWPAILPEHAKLPDVRLIGLVAPEDKYGLLRAHMKLRGDSPEVVEARMKQVIIDSLEMEMHKGLIGSHGKVFELQDDSVVPEQVMPWILQQIA